MERIPRVKRGLTAYRSAFTTASYQKIKSITAPIIVHEPNSCAVEVVTVWVQFVQVTCSGLGPKIFGGFITVGAVGGFSTGGVYGGGSSEKKSDN